MFVGVLTMSVGSSTGHAADKPPQACPLLTATEIGAMVGGTVGQPHEDAMAITEGPAKGQTMAMCNWPTSSQSGLSLAVTRALPGAQREAGLAQVNKTLDALKTQGRGPEPRGCT